MRRPLVVVLLPGAALLLVDGVAFDLGEAQEAADHGEVFPERPVLRGGILLPTQQLAEPALKEGLEREREGESRSVNHGLKCEHRSKNNRREVSSALNEFQPPGSIETGSRNNAVLHGFT